MNKFSVAKIISAFLSTVILSISLSACKADVPGKSEKVTIRVGYFGTAQYQAQLAVAKEKGFFDEAFKDTEVEIEYSFFAGAGPAINEAMLAGDLDVAFGVGDQPTLSGISNGNGDVIVSRIVKNARGQGIIVGYNSGISSLEELAGKKIAVGVGTANQKTLDLYLADANLTENDVEIVNISKLDDQLAALTSGEIDAAFTANLAFGLDKAESGKIAKLLVDGTAHPNYAYLSVNKNFAETNAEVFRKFVDALYKADKWYAENQDEGIRITAEFLNIDVETARKGCESCDIKMVFDEDDFNNLQITYDFMEKNELLPNKIDDLSSIVDDSFIKTAISNN